MATLTSNISNVSLTVSGTTTQSATISWTLPIVPAGSTVTARTLTGTATASMNKGSATIKVNNQSVSSGSSFTIDLGANNTTTSVSVTAVGGNKNASGTVTFSNLVYTVTYTEPVVTYTVTFVDWDGTVLKTEEVGSGSSATAPEVSRYGYAFTGWSVDFSNVTSNIITTAQYVAINMFRIKENGNWTNVSKIYKKISDVWVEQDNSSWPDLFNTNTSYIKCGLPTAILYEDGTFVFSSHDNIDISHGNIVSQYIGWESESYNSPTEVPWDSNQSLIQKIYINNIKANSTSMWFSNCDNLLYANINGLNNVTTMYSMFYNCSNLTSLDLSNFDTSNVTNMRTIFYNCSNLTSLDLSSFDTSNVTNMSYMFSGCSGLTSLNLSNFDTSNVTNMSYMFRDCSGLTSLDLSNFDTSNVTDMSHMFNRSSGLTSLDLSSFNTSNVTNMYTMFYNCSNLTSLDLSGFDTSNVTNMSFMFGNCSNLTSLNVSNFDTSNVTDMSYMFQKCSALTSLDLSGFDMSKITSTTSMFNGCTNLQTIYVKDETAKTKIESSTNFPSTATVIIGKPN